MILIEQDKENIQSGLRKVIIKLIKIFGENLFSKIYESNNKNIWKMMCI